MVCVLLDVIDGTSVQRVTLNDFLYQVRIPVQEEHAGKPLCLAIPYLVHDGQVYFEPHNVLQWLGYDKVDTATSALSHLSHSTHIGLTCTTCNNFLSSGQPAPARPRPGRSPGGTSAGGRRRGGGHRD